MNSIQLPNLTVLLMATFLFGSLGLVFALWWANRKKEGQTGKKTAESGKAKGKVEARTKTKGNEAVQTKTEQAKTEANGLETQTETAKSNAGRLRAVIKTVVDAVLKAFVWFKGMSSRNSNKPKPGNTAQNVSSVSRSVSPPVGSFIVKAAPERGMKNVTPSWTVPPLANDAPLPVLNGPNQPKLLGKSH